MASPDLTVKQNNASDELQRFFNWQNQIRKSAQSYPKRLNEAEAVHCILETLVTVLQADRALLVKLRKGIFLPIKHEYRRNNQVPTLYNCAPSLQYWSLLRRAADSQIYHTVDVLELDEVAVNPELHDFFLTMQIRGEIACPVVCADELLGIVVVHSAIPRSWRIEELSLVEVAADQVALISLKQSTDQLEHSNKELEAFATIASHDLQEPLRKVRLFSQQMSQHCSGEGQGYLTRIQGAVNRMQNLISDLLALSQVKFKRRPFRRISLRTALTHVLDDLELMIQELNAEVIIEPLAEIEADPKQIEQLFQNLLENALKFHRPGIRPVIRIYGQWDTDPHYYQIFIEDNGIGFVNAHRDRIFEPFKRLHNKDSYPGTGMGLTICRRIIERHSGSLTASGKPGEGATFKVRLPVEQAAVSGGIIPPG